jgi:diaminohydroxyphosphoribosylaminopyrimidine deaminase/5-amino-6-(5-phosphoribosylamino)uracil reductase
MYVTLEPCAHEGRTPPCVDAIIDSGIENVVIGALDPDTRVDGSGAEQLRRAGIEVSHGVIAAEVEALDPGYFHHRRTGLPHITLKLATTLDGQIAAADRTSQWITGTEARQDGHRLRAEADVVIVGAGTLLDDDPGLDVRLRGYRGRQPRPVVIAGGRPLSPDAALFRRDPLIYTSELCDLPAEQVIVPGGDRVDLSVVLADLGKRGYVAALVEGGATLARELLEGRHVDRLVLYLGCKLGMGIGLPAFSGSFETLEDALDVEIEAVERLGEDIRIDARVVG